jgi:ligand-binding sensor domain-containing protein
MGYLFRDSVWKPFIVLWVLWTTLCPDVTAKDFPSELVQILGVKEGLSQSTVYDIVQDKDGYIWSATGEGLNRFEGYPFHTIFKDIRNPYGLSNSIDNVLCHIRHIYEKLQVNSKIEAINKLFPENII